MSRQSIPPGSPGPAFDPAAFLESETRKNGAIVFPKGKILFAQGDVAEKVFYIKKGRVKITVVSRHGKEAVIGILAAGDLIGEGCLNGQLLRLTTATAMTESTILQVPKAEIQRLLETSVAFSQYFIGKILTKNRKVEEDLIDQLFNSTEKRLARALLLLANFGKEGRPELVAAKISQDVLAEMIGTTRSQVNHFMNKFRRLGFIEYNGGLEVRSALLNVVLSEPSPGESAGR